MKDHILVVGGYGHVGKDISRKLGDLYPGKVIAAGRNLVKAEQFCQTMDWKVLPLQLNISDWVDPRILDNVKLVIMCLDQSNTSFVQFCFNQGVDYIDLSANYEFLSQVQRLHAQAKANEVTAVLSIGLAPGLTNLLAEHARRQMDQIDAVDIFILLGMGDHHGKAAVEWTINSLISDFFIMQNNNKVKVSSFSNGKKIDFGGDVGQRMAYRFNFSDQHVIPNTIGVPSVSTRLCFDSRSVTFLVSLIKRSGFVQLLKNKFIRRRMVNLYRAITVKNEKVAVKIEATGKKGGNPMLVEYFLHGKQNEALITARVATVIAEVMYNSTLPSGVHHIEQLTDLEDVLQDIGDIIRLETRLNGKLLPNF